MRENRGEEIVIKLKLEEPHDWLFTSGPRTASSAETLQKLHSAGKTDCA